MISLTPGYSRDHRPDLNQVVLELIAENSANLPVLMQPLSGNTSDKRGFTETIQAHAGQLIAAGVEVVVIDSAGYTPTTIGTLEAVGVTWVKGPSHQQDCQRPPGGRW